MNTYSIAALLLVTSLQSTAMQNGDPENPESFSNRNSVEDVSSEDSSVDLAPSTSSSAVPTASTLPVDQQQQQMPTTSRAAVRRRTSSSSGSSTAGIPRRQPRLGDTAKQLSVDAGFARQETFVRIVRHLRSAASYGNGLRHCNLF